MLTERAEEDWANAWKSHFSVHRVGRRVLVKAPWHDFDPAPGDIVVELVSKYRGARVTKSEIHTFPHISSTRLGLA